MSALEGLALLTARATVVLVLARLTAHLLREAPAAVRHRVWALAFIGLLALPLMAVLLPPVTVPLPAPLALRSPAVEDRARRADVSGTGPSAIQPPHPSVPVSGAEKPSAGNGIPIPDPDGAPARALAQALLAVWGLGALALLARRLQSVLRRRAVWRRAPAVRTSRASEIATVSREIGLRRSVTARVSPAAPVPMTWGTVRPALLLPIGFEGWSAARRRQSLLHELAHTRRGDAAFQLLARCAVALLWFHPLVWIAERHLRAEAERACDDAVLLSGVRPSSYADHLLSVARSLRTGQCEPSPVVVPMARRAELPGRIAAVLDAHQPRGRLGRWQATIGALLAVAVLAPLAAATWSDGERGRIGIPLGETVDVAPEGLFASPGYRQLCPPQQHVESRVASHGDRVTMEIVRGPCRLEVEVRGVDATGGTGTPLALERSERLEILESTPAGEVRLVIAAGSDGPEHRLSVDGEARSFDEAARAWLDRILLELCRASGLDADRRVAWLLHNAGVPAVLAEVEAIRSDRVRGIYLRELLARARLEASDTTRVLELVRDGMRSDHEQSKVLRAVAARRLAAALHPIYLEAAGTLDSDFERSRVLRALLEWQPLPAATVAGVLEEAGEMSSNHERSRVVRSALEAIPPSAPVPGALIDLLPSLRSDHLRAEILHRVIDRRELSGPELEQVLTVIETIRPEHERAELLVALAGRAHLSGRSREHYLRVVRSITSERERGRALSAVAGGA